MDITLSCIDSKNKQVIFAGAMNPLVHVTNGTLTEYKADRCAIGGLTPQDYKFSSQTIPYQLGDWFYMFSDGFKDQFGGDHGKKYMNNNFLKLLNSASASDPQLQKQALKNELEQWRGKYERIDDVLVIGFRM